MEAGYIILIVLFIIVLVALILIVILVLFRLFNPVQLIQNPPVVSTSDPLTAKLALSGHTLLSATNPKSFVLSDKTIVLYSYCESSSIRKGNLEFFLRHGFYYNHPLIDYIIVINGPSTIQIPSAPNLKVVNRENNGRDFEAWAYGLTFIDSDFKYFVFVNDSVRGPLIPLHINNVSWIDCFLSRLNDKVKVVGATISVEGGIHLQTYSWATDRVLIPILKQAKVFNPKPNLDFNSYIDETERLVSMTAFKAGYNLDCFMPIYQGVDWLDLYKRSLVTGRFTTLDGKVLASANPNSIWQMHPLECLFFKYKTYTQPVFNFYHLE
jgi:hypothetical protein